MAKETIALTVRLDPELSREFKRLAIKNNRNQAILVRDWIADYVAREKKKES